MGIISQSIESRDWWSWKQLELKFIYTKKRHYDKKVGLFGFWLEMETKNIFKILPIVEG